ncbi:uncharacterized protein KY384_003255 [Bacidia gigantensis]|uniref:uncharacterized protein n=1 Tax=Bacidia gigantensis TaxID=2732470 RepID=UPI001D056916|nr:uncharacterized protein KY384_003255 [Bacidia gigantensis]KAG8531624.1 hypothetical protein KY384_003255 [Bacidia gigantensis]
MTKRQAQTQRKSVYLQCRKVFTGTNARVRKVKKVRKLLEKNQHLFATLADQYNFETICDVAKELLDAGIFDSTSKAETQFPELFRSSDSGWEGSESSDSGWEGSESSDFDATRSELDAMEETISSEEESIRTSHVPDLKASSCGILSKHCKNLPSRATSEIPGVSLRDVLFKTRQIRHTAVHRRLTSVWEIEEMIRNAASLTTILKDAVRTRRIELIRHEVRLTTEELNRVQNGLEMRTSEELATVAHQRILLDEREEKAIEFMLSEGNQNRLGLGSKLDELLMSYQRSTALDFHYPEEMSYVKDVILKVEDFEAYK